MLGPSLRDAPESCRWAVEPPMTPTLLHLIVIACISIWALCSCGQPRRHYVQTIEVGPSDLNNGPIYAVDMIAQTDDSDRIGLCIGHARRESSWPIAAELRYSNERAVVTGQLWMLPMAPVGRNSRPYFCSIDRGWVERSVVHIQYAKIVGDEQQITTYEIKLKDFPIQ